MTNGQHLKEKTLRCQSRCCTIKDFKTAIITMLHEVKVNTHVMYRKIEVLNRKIKNLKRIK